MTPKCHRDTETGTETEPNTLKVRSFRRVRFWPCEQRQRETFKPTTKIKEPEQ